MIIELKLLIAGVALFVISRIMRAAYFNSEKNEWQFKGKEPQNKPSKILKEIYEWIETGWSAVILAAILMYFIIQAFKIPSASMRTTLLEGDHLFVNKFIYGLHVPLGGGKRVLDGVNWRVLGIPVIKKVERGDIIIFQAPPSALSSDERQEKISKDFIKRCIALGGDTVEVKDKRVYVNYQLLNEPYTSFVDPMVYGGPSIFPSQEKYQKMWEQGEFNNKPFSEIRDNFGPIVVPKGCYFAMGDNRDQSFDSRFWGPLEDRLLKGSALLIYWPPNRIRLIK
jgi:signal peptidase I